VPGTFDRIAELPIEIESYELEGLDFKVGDFERLTTVIHMRGGGEEGVGEDVVYDGLDHVALQAAGAVHDLTGPSTIGELCELTGGLDLFPEEPQRDVSRRYRRWAFESAALDLALRQAGQSLPQAVGRGPSPLVFVASMRLSQGEDQPSSIEPLQRKRKHHPGLRFKLDPTNDWTDDLIAELVETGAVDSLDLKGFYKGTPVDVDTDPDLYRRVAEAFPDAWLEDPDLNDETRPVLEPHYGRVTWDAPIHAVADIEGLPFKPTMVNVKPSRIGGLEELCAAYDYCDANGIGAYGGGQWELGPGRGQIQYLACLFHPETPNDVAPTPYNNEREPGPEVPDSPLEPALAPTGFRWDG
jgi:L-alanine-DL-glutamate epimerase-like enolase superfamily enzyme